MNHLLCILFVMVLCVELGNAKPFAPNRLYFKNSLGPTNDLKINCTFNKRDLGIFFVKPGNTEEFRFHGTYSLKNIIDCSLYQKPGPHAMIRAYEGSSGAFDHGKRNYWDAREDGIYFTHGKEVPKLEYKWI
ncbi:hypothetical protein EUTSA_v10023189mg [Eutrema salsugineum]|uniref:Uncharacterized protein n=1 Tax=Eutrema salsugineum TaxID=72664 RepID=V4LJB8_EUTSA|nr:hypothetical protein EUTSA_v10023189mg [Eutrema salsugineum]